MGKSIELSTSAPVSTTNACKLCTPLGACLAFRGVEGCVPFLHGSQGCATYIRRYLISHFKEPMDIASSSFNETTAIYGGGDNLKQGLTNVTKQYKPKLIGISTTCLSETIGDDVRLHLREYRNTTDVKACPEFVHVSTPSYNGTHINGFHNTVKALVEALAEGGPRTNTVNILPNMVSPADMRYLKEILVDFDLDAILLPDYSETLDGPASDHYDKIPPGGTPIHMIRRMGRSRATLEFGQTLSDETTAASVLYERHNVKRYTLGLPIGVTESDSFFHMLEKLSGHPIPEKHWAERGRLIDAYVDGHKYVFGKKAVIYGEEDLVIGIASFLVEIGVVPILCASGGESGRFAEALRKAIPELPNETRIRGGVDFMEISEEAASLSPDLLIGNSKGYSIARRLKTPLIRIGFPIHDRIGGQRMLHLGYRGAQNLFDRVVNALLEMKQDVSPVGYSYL